ncbi:MAG: dTMP kinase, partial [Burkholderiaceae bacterium]
VHPHLQPDLTLLFNVPLAVARARLDKSREPDRFEQEQATFFAATQAEYLRRAEQFPKRFRLIDSTKSIVEVNQQLEVIIKELG